jgi:hypothetical protein
VIPRLRMAGRTGSPAENLVCTGFDLWRNGPTSSVQDSRYKDGTGEAGFLALPLVPYRAFAVRPLPCNYNVIQPISALSRRKRGFKSRRGRQFNILRKNCLLSV